MWNWIKDKFNKLKSISYDWLPLSGMVLIVYMIQRGFSAIAKSGVVEMNLKQGMGIFFTTVSLSVLALGFMSDRVKAHYLIAAATFAGVLGILGAAFNMWLFGIGLGLAAAAVKILPFAVPLKNKDSEIDSLRVAPQASAKTFGSALFYLLLAAVVKAAGFSMFAAAAAALFAFFGTWASFAVKDHSFKLLSWSKTKVAELLKTPKWWYWTAWHTIIGCVYYLCITKVIPAFMTFGMTKMEAIYAFGIAALSTALLRWPGAWLGTKIGYWRAMLIAGVWQLANIWLLINHPIIGLPSFFIGIQLNTQNYWACAKEWFKGDKLGTAIGMAFVITYIALGFTFGRW